MKVINGTTFGGDRYRLVSEDEDSYSLQVWIEGVDPRWHELGSGPLGFMKFHARISVGDIRWESEK